MGRGHRLDITLSCDVGGTFIFLDSANITTFNFHPYVKKNNYVN